jgi:hypothetical protein
MMDNQSKYDPSRKTVGAIYRDAQLHGERQLITGDMNYELRQSLVVDLNDTVKQGSLDFEGRPFYITVHEKRDLQMKNAFIRRMIKTVYRPYPEDDTLVFKVIPYTNEIYFCWELPHRTNMLNMLNCPDLYDAEELMKYRHWENMRLEYFGFMKNEEGNWKENPLYSGDAIVSLKNEPAAVISLFNANQTDTSPLAS